MQDRFKYRCWHEPTKTMYEVFDFNENFIRATPDFVVPSIRTLKTRDCVLLQCTGLKDNQGKLIYEGDIIYKKGSKNYKKEKMYSRVCWNSMYAQFNISDENGMHQMPSNSNNIEIVGNIYENEELLKEVNNENVTFNDCCVFVWVDMERYCKKNY